MDRISIYFCIFINYTTLHYTHVCRLVVFQYEWAEPSMQWVNQAEHTAHTHTSDHAAVARPGSARLGPASDAPSKSVQGRCKFPRTFSFSFACRAEPSHAVPCHAGMRSWVVSMIHHWLLMSTQLSIKSNRHNTQKSRVEWEGEKERRRKTI